MSEFLSARRLVAIAWSLFQVYTVAAGMFDLLIQLPLHVAFALTLAFLTPRAAGERVGWGSRGAALLSALMGVYFILENPRLVTRMPFVDEPRVLDMVVGCVFLALLLEASRRLVGAALTVLALVFVAYAFVGPWLPGFLSHGGTAFARFLDGQVLSTEGVFGIPTLVSATYIYLFILFGCFMSRVGLIQFFTDLALSLAGWSRGGAAKVAVISSGLFGTINGSAIANSVATGSFTIPLMKRAGYRPEFAAGVEATASMGGQLIPPVMGAAAFIMAETLGVSYATVAVSAAIPGVLYFFAVGVMVHLEAARLGLPFIPRSELPRLREVLAAHSHLLVGPAALVYLLVAGRTPLYAGLWAIIIGVAASFLRRRTRITLRVAVEALIETAQNALPVALACAAVGIVVGVVAVTGLGLKIASGIVALSGGHLLLTLLFTTVAALVLGTGLPTSATYIITSVMAAPALLKLGLPPLVAHMFVFYFGILADLTPPTAISTYATSAIAGADVWRTQWTAMLLALSGFLIPFSFAYDPSMLLVQATPLGVIGRTAAATLGILMLGAGIVGYLWAPTRLLERFALLVGSLLLIFPGLWGDLLGVLAFVGVCAAQRLRRTGSPSAPRALSEP
ncbi:MAG: TRAP transporter fused permease subunit [Candidatus Rokubacteria bacterium]|nr:TRAP transporter fused permease subunit [Candidatus Rokubacteria bacterium]